MKMQKMFLVVLLIAFLATLMIAQSSTAKITGKVVTADGTAIPGVLITATNPKMIGKSVSISDENGVYRLLNLGAGVYKVIFELEGFATMVQPKIVLGVEQTLRIPIVMELKKLKETIIVEGQVPLIDVKSASQGMNLNKETFDSLPKGRDFTSLVTAIPGVIDEPLLAGISIDGASGSENVFYIDGVDVTNLVNGTQGQNAAFDFVEEVQVKSSGYMAEFGGSLGGVISAITRSGGNEFHGDVIAYYSGSTLRGTPRELLSIDLEDSTKAKYYAYEDLRGERSDIQIETGFSLGGYLLKDKVWFFGSFLPRFTTFKNHVNYVDSTDVKDHTTKFTSMNYMIKVSAQILSNVRWSASYMNNYSQYRGFDLFEDQGAWGPYGNYTTDFDTHGYDFPNYSASTALDITIGNNSMLNIRAGLFFSNQENNLTVIPSVPWYVFAGGTDNLSYPEIPDNFKHTAGWSSGANWEESKALNLQLAEKKSAGIDYNLYFNLGGEHSLKIGGQFVRQGEEVDAAWQQPLVILYWGDPAVLGGTNYGIGEYGYVQVRGDTNTGMFGSEYKAYSNRYNFYIQDSWTIGEKLTLNFGVRAESEYIPSYSSHPDFVDAKPIEFSFGDKLAPRLGFVYDVKGDSSFKIFGSYGLFFDVMKLEMANGSYGGFKWKSAYYTIDDYDFTKITYDNNPGTLLKVIDWRVPSFDTTDPDLKPMSQQAISIGFENKLNEDLSLSVRLVNKHLRYTIEDVGVLIDGSEHYYTANPGYGWSLLEKNGGMFDDAYPETPRAKREYWAVNFALDKRFSKNWMGGFSYTWSSLKGNYAGLASSDEDGRDSPNVARYYDAWFLAFDKDLNKIDGPLATDRPHVIKAYGSYIFPFGMTLGTVINVMSGTPVTEEWTLYNMEMFPYNRGNMGRTPMRYNADMYAEYNLKLGKANLQFSVNITNIFSFKIAQMIVPLKTANELEVNYEQMLSKDWEYPEDTRPHVLFGMEARYTAPISARLGLKLSF